ncbi:BrnT family toxin [Candidatus Parcubacteria bacterium]|nr:BrnT family toxin [Patescibacteria group bacterium]MBU4381042.1 BrnT family toxin [Patescibacteria group bacterium]MCG2689055.1 BrnT family toxin [Candidatus Parcubacteria bacterium]
MKHFDWDEEKNQKLKLERDISFEDVLVSIEEGNLLDIVAHPIRKNQQVMVVMLNSYVYLVPFVEDEEKVFLKTIIPSRKATKKYLL